MSSKITFILCTKDSAENEVFYVDVLPRVGEYFHKVYSTCYLITAVVHKSSGYPELYAKKVKTPPHPFEAKKPAKR